MVVEGTEVGAEMPAGAVTGAVTGSMDAMGPAAGAACTTTTSSECTTAADGVSLLAVLSRQSWRGAPFARYPAPTTLERHVQLGVRQYT